MKTAIAVAISQELHAVLGGDDFWQALPPVKGLHRAFRSQPGRGSSHELLLVETGLGPLNAASSVALAAHHHNVSHVVLIGLCGAIAGQLKIGDVVVPRALLQHDSFRSSSQDNQILLRPGVSSFDRQAHANPLIKTDPCLTEQLVTLLANSGIPTQIGVMASGSEFMCSPRRKKNLLALSGEIIAVDMESCGAAIACENMGIPFSALKIVSDAADPLNGTIINDFKANLDHCLAKLSEVSRCLKTLVPKK